MKLTYDDAEARQAAEMYRTGMAYTAIAQRFAVTRTTAVKMVDQGRAARALDEAAAKVRADELGAHSVFALCARALGVSVQTARAHYAAPQEDVEAALRAGMSVDRVTRCTFWPGHRVRRLSAELAGRASPPQRCASLAEIVATVRRRGGRCYLGELIYSFPAHEAERVRAGVRELTVRGVVLCEQQRVGGRPQVKVIEEVAEKFRREHRRALHDRDGAIDEDLKGRTEVWRRLTAAELVAEHVAREQCLRGELEALAEKAAQVMEEVHRAERARHLGLVPSLRDEGRRLAARAREVEAELAKLPARRSVEVAA